MIGVKKVSEIEELRQENAELKRQIETRVREIHLIVQR